jgi:hypothetical protein
MRHVVRMGEAVRFAIDHQFDIALRPALDVLAAMGAGFLETELAEQRGQLPGFGFIDSEFDEAHGQYSFRHRDFLVALQAPLSPGRPLSIRHG